MLGQNVDNAFQRIIYIWLHFSNIALIVNVKRSDFYEMSWWCAGLSPKCVHMLYSCIAINLPFNKFKWNELRMLIILSPSPEVCSISLTTCHARWPGGLARASHWSECHLGLSLATAPCPRYVLQKSQDSFLIEDQVWSPIGLQTLSCPLSDLCSRLCLLLASYWLLSPFPALPLAGWLTVTSVWQNASHMSPLPHPY